MVDLRQLTYFEAVYRLGSFSKAAEELRLSHSAITKGIKVLETNWGVQLLHRTTRIVEPTESGRRLYPMAVRLLALAKATKKEAIHGEREVVIVTGPFVLAAQLPDAILEFAKIFPDTKITIDTLPPLLAIDELVNRRAHLLLYHDVTLKRLPQAKQLRIKPLIHDPIVIGCRPGHEVLQLEPTNENLLRFDWAVSAYRSAQRFNFPQDLRAAMIKAGFPKYRLASLNACVELAMRSDVLVSPPESFAARFVAENRLCTIPHNFPYNMVTAGATLIDTNQEKSVETFMDCIVHSFENRA